ncbi:MAG: B12-binding domain-containing radical SAM protein [Magnetococcales bacterium]|nr:B12-binding domain-containing radical SAM protein [Magnetococcales bacterium]
MKILLILPRFTSVLKSYDMPLGILYISAALKQAGKSVYNFNLNHHEGLIENLVKQAIDQIDPDICACGGISVHTQTIKKIFTAARKAKPSIINIAGGGMVSADPEMAAELIDFDIGVIGEGEKAIVEIVDALTDNTPIENVPGLVIKQDGKPAKLTSDRDINHDISSLAWPDFAGFQEERLLELQIPQGNYVFNIYNNPRAIPIISSRSCPLSCTFCYHPNGKVYRERDLDDFFAELDHLIATYDVNIVMVLDELLSIKKKRLETFCQRIKPYKIKWLCQLHEKSIDKELLELLKESGCAFISLGIESMSLPILKSMKKLTTPQKLDDTIKLIYDSNIGLQGNFLNGDPAETLETIAETFDYWVHHPQYVINYIKIQALPGSEIYKNAIQNGKIADPKKAFLDPLPNINLTALPDDIFYPIYNRIDFYSGTLLYVGRVESFTVDEKPHKVLGHGFTCQWRCPRCDNSNIYENLFPVSWMLRLTCRHCMARSFLQMWNHQFKADPHGDAQLVLAERHNEIFHLTGSKSSKVNAEIEFLKLLKEHCLPLLNNFDKPWACVAAALEYGKIKLQQGDNSTGMKFLAYALLRNSWNPECHAAFADGLLQEGSIGMALLYYKKAIELSKDPRLSWITSRDKLEQAIKEQGLKNNLVDYYFKPFRQLAKKIGSH